MAKEVLVPMEDNSYTLEKFPKAITNTLDELSGCRLLRSGKTRKNKCLKYRSKSRGQIPVMPNNMSKFSVKSDSDSSFDNWIDQHIGTQKVFSIQTDSDEKKTLSMFSNWRPCVNNAGESDSVAENVPHSRGTRRKRKLKRAAIDSSAITQDAFHSSNDALMTRKTKRKISEKFLKTQNMSLKCNKFSKLSSQISSKMKDIRPNFPSASTTYGKRKRDDRSIDCNSSHSSGFDSDQNAFKAICSYSNCSSQMELCVDDCPVEFAASRTSSGESDCELSTNDESREADDEQSDFLCEPGSSIKDNDYLKSDHDDEFKMKRRNKAIVEKDIDELSKCYKLLSTKYIPHSQDLFQFRQLQMYEEFAVWFTT